MESKPTVLALTGPPASGKSTIVGILEDMGVPCKGTGDAIRDEAHRRYDDPDEDDVWDVAESLRDEHGSAGPTIACADWIEAQDADVICVSDLREQAEVDWLREQVGPTLTMLVDADQTEREYRYVERELDDEEPGINRSKVEDLRQELRDREERERPYPSHDVTLWNSDSVDMYAVCMKLEHVVEVLRA